MWKRSILPREGPPTPAVFTVSATPVVQAVVNAASYAVGAVSPGEFVSLFGMGIGPATAAEMTVAAGYAAMTLNNVSVTIDGQKRGADLLERQYDYSTSALHRDNRLGKKGSNCE